MAMILLFVKVTPDGSVIDRKNDCDKSAFERPSRTARVGSDTLPPRIRVSEY